jgi:uncharacterized protein (TIRG00374 family)
MKKQVQIWGGIALAGAILYFMFRGTDWAAVGEAFRAAHPGWLALSGLFVFLTFFTRVQRWTYIVRSTKPVSYSVLFSATQIGFLANFTLPGRVGEVIRALVLARLAKLPFVKCFAFVALDRVTDLFGLLAMMLVTVIAFRPQQDFALPPGLPWESLPASIIQTGVLSTTVILCAVIAAFVLLFVSQNGVLRLMERVLGTGVWARRLQDSARHFAEGLHIFRNRADVLRSIAWSLLTWLIGGLSYHFLMLGFGIDPPWYAMCLVLTILSIVISLPGAPGFVGQFHAAIMVAVLILLPDTPANTARAMAIASHLLNLLPIALTGIYCIYRENLGLLQLQREGEQAEAELQHANEHSGPAE